MIAPDEEANYACFRDCFSDVITSKLAPVSQGRTTKGRKNEITPVTSPTERQSVAVGELAEFIEYLASEAFESQLSELRKLSYDDIKNDIRLAEKYDTPLSSETYNPIYELLPESFSKSFDTYELLRSDVDLARVLEPVFNSYVDAVTTAPSEYQHTQRGTECEICERDQLPLTYHHLIPKQMHEKAVKRGWVKDWEVLKVAWLCRACHNFVHQIASNEVLARELNSIELLMEREDVQSWSAWIGKIRWKKK